MVFSIWCAVQLELMVTLIRMTAAYSVFFLMSFGMRSTRVKYLLFVFIVLKILLVKNCMLQKNVLSFLYIELTTSYV